MKKLLYKIYMWIEDRRNWNAKMSDPLIFKVVSTPQKNKVGDNNVVTNGYRETR